MNVIVIVDMKNGWKLIKRTVYTNPGPDQWHYNWEYNKIRD